MSTSIKERSRNAVSRTSGRSPLRSVGFVGPLAVMFGALGAPALANGDVLAGIDTWSTPAGEATQDFSSSPIPADFFGPGSDPFPGVISLSGDPAGLGNPAITAVDTIVERLSDAILPTCPSVDTVPIEIVALSLVSASPITVTYGGGGGELWDVRVCLSSAFPQSIGSMTISHECLEGGTYSSVLPVTPKFIFTRQSDSLTLTLDNGIEVVLLWDEGCWVHEADPGFGVPSLAPGLTVDGDCDGLQDAPLPGTTNFVPGLFPDPCDCSSPGTAQIICPSLEHPAAGSPFDVHHPVVVPQKGCCWLCDPLYDCAGQVPESDCPAGWNWVPGAACGTTPCGFPCDAKVPAMSKRGLILTALLLLIATAVLFRRKASKA